MKESYFLTVCTLGSNKNLSTCLAKLLEIKVNTDYEIEILLVVNRSSIDLDINPIINVVFEPAKGYSNVRNAAVNFIPENANLIFIDDDEIPTLRWFNALVAKHRKYPSDIIFGPVYSNFNSSTNAYRDQFRHRFDQLSDESLVKQAGAGNMLIPQDLIKTGMVYFHPIFNLSGSEDTDFCFRIRKMGRRIRYAKNAEICEVQTSERFDSRYQDYRYIRDICNYSLVIRTNSNRTLIVWRFCSLTVRIALYGAFSIFSKNFSVQFKAYLLSLKTLVTGKPFLG